MKHPTQSPHQNCRLRCFRNSWMLLFIRSFFKYVGEEQGKKTGEWGVRSCIFVRATAGSSAIGGRKASSSCAVILGVCSGITGKIPFFWLEAAWGSDFSIKRVKQKAQKYEYRFSSWSDRSVGDKIQQRLAVKVEKEKSQAYSLRSTGQPRAGSCVFPTFRIYSFPQDILGNK